MTTSKKDIRIILASVTMILLLLILSAFETKNKYDIMYLIFITYCLMKLAYIKLNK